MSLHHSKLQRGLAGGRRGQGGPTVPKEERLQGEAEIPKGQDKGERWKAFSGGESL